MIKKILLGIVALILALLGTILKSDYLSFLQWWITILYLGLIFMPLTFMLFSSFHDKGYLFSKAIGIAITGYLMWLLSSLHIMKFSNISCVIVSFIALVINIVIYLYQRKHNLYFFGNPSASDSGKMHSFVETIITEELIFFALFLIFTYFRGFKPEAYGTEKFMDYGFMTTMMRSDFMPPRDLWFSQGSINYYYVGQYLSTFLTKLSFVKVNVGYNFMLMMIAAFSFVLPYSLVSNLIINNCKDRGRKSKILPPLSGTLAGAAVCLAGNMHYTIYKWIKPFIRTFSGHKFENDYWFPDATRYIGYDPATHDKTIHEFPSYSFILGDLHAHVINIIFVLTVLGILFAWQIARKKRKENKQKLLTELFHPSILMIGFFIGLFHTTNFWDYPIYYVTAGAVILFSNGVVYNFKVKTILITFLQGIIVFATAEIVCLPFTLKFDQISAVPYLTEACTPIYQLMVLWGLPIFIVTSFICFLIAGFIRKAKLVVVDKEHKKPAFFRFFLSISESDRFILLIGLCALGLILLPELIYVKDIYDGDYKRANTMFKLTYQAFIMFGICSGYLFVRLINLRETRWQRVVGIISLVLFLSTLLYPINASKSWYGNVLKTSGYKGLDAAAFMETTMPDDYLATNWLNDNVKGTPVVLEANGDSYTDYERVSVMTGLPTVLGWYTHERLWRSNPSTSDEEVVAILNALGEDIKTIYTSDDIEKVKELIKKYDISYIYVGKLEKDKYGSSNDELLKSLGDVVFAIPAIGSKTYETYIVKIEK